MFERWKKVLSSTTRVKAVQGSKPALVTAHCLAGTSDDGLLCPRENAMEKCLRLFHKEIIGFLGCSPDLARFVGVSHSCFELGSKVLWKRQLFVIVNEYQIVQVFDPLMRQWREPLRSINDFEWCPQITVQEDRHLIIVGQSGRASRFDPRQQSWTTLTDKINLSRLCPIVGSISSGTIVAGGWNHSKGSRTGTIMRSAKLVDPHGGVHRLPRMHEERMHGVGGRVFDARGREMFIVVGGSNNYGRTNSCEAFFPCTNEWISQQSLPELTCSIKTAVVWRNKLVCAGVGPGIIGECRTIDLWCFDVAEKQWSRLPSPPAVEHDISFQMSVCNDRIIVLVDARQRQFSVVFEYASDDGRWHLLCQDVPKRLTTNCNSASVPFAAIDPIANEAMFRRQTD